MSHLTLQTGFPGDRTSIDVHWHDHDHVAHVTRLEINVAKQDKPRTLQILLDGMVISGITSDMTMVHKVRKTDG